MSTPERSQDPGEHGYGGTNQDYPQADEHDGSSAPAEGDEAEDANDEREAPDPQESNEAI